MINPSLFQSIQSDFTDCNLLETASEAHGILCGLFYLPRRDLVFTLWLNVLFQERQATQVLETSLKILYDSMLDYLEQDEFEFGFDLLLPDDDQPLNIRVHELSKWCQGFIYGLGLASFQAPLDNRDILEFIHDVQEIGKADSNAETTETDEFAYVELVEYIKVGVLLIYQYQREQQEQQEQ